MNSSHSNDYVDYTKFSEYKAGTLLWKIFPPILIAFGTCGNILSIIVLRRKNIRKSVCSIYLIALSVMDLVVLYTGLLRQWINMTFDTDIRELGKFLCKFHMWLVYFSLDMSSWILIAVTVERVCLVWFPQVAKSKCTKQIAIIMIVVIATFLLAANCHIFYGFGEKVVINNGTLVTQKCTYLYDGYEKFWLDVWPWLDLALFCGIPFACLLIGNLLIFGKVMASQRAIKRQIVPSGNSQNPNIHKKETKLSSMSVMLFTLNTVFLICTTPISVYLIGWPTWHGMLTGRDYAVLDMMWAVVNIMMYLNNTINFLLYILSGSRFRREFIDMFRRKKNENPTVMRNESVTKVHCVTTIPTQRDQNNETRVTMIETVS